MVKYNMIKINNIIWMSTEDGFYLTQENIKTLQSTILKQETYINNYNIPNYKGINIIQPTK